MNKDQINIAYNYLHNYNIAMNHFEEICLMVEHDLSRAEYYIYKILRELAVNSNVQSMDKYFDVEIDSEQNHKLLEDIRRKFFN